MVCWLLLPSLCVCKVCEQILVACVSVSASVSLSKPDSSPQSMVPEGTSALCGEGLGMRLDLMPICYHDGRCVRDWLQMYGWTYNPKFVSLADFRRKKGPLTSISSSLNPKNVCKLSAVCLLCNV